MSTSKIWLALKHPEFFPLSWSWTVSFLRLSASPEIRAKPPTMLERLNHVMVSLSPQECVVQAIQRGVWHGL